ncbi:MAG: chemotaxis protein CheA [Gammaproteobacteria bacterium]|nr:chemotaxis protein CheA [Gammaproteobacteria bacterium]MBU3997687.1 chemotaxis protein CheA [Gammaproteobacteria bacterium]MBU4019492.1 chemotaxis protein CheA [Gammaproteobacteria bacterium]MBU4079006.1 chemotaxis protein CheA [Gammaproteobacteria bacterium]MBU4115376.1 chemotaxis protein CheA [Gammaproteobacteria bacterium]
MNLDDALQTLVIESRELLEGMEDALLAIEQAQDKDELINAIFRAAHTIKGSSGLFGLDHIVAFTHVVESVLDQVRAGKLSIADQLIVLLLLCRDHIAALIEAVAQGQSEPSAELQQQGEPILLQLRAYLAPPAATSTQVTTGVMPGIDPIARIAGDHGVDHWHISVRFGADVLRNGMDPLSFLRYLQTLGKIIGIATLADAIPKAELMDPETCYLGFEIALQSDADKKTIENVFEFVRDDCRLRILAPHSLVDDYIGLINSHPNTGARVGEMLLSCGSLTAQELDTALDTQADSPAKPIGTILVEQGSVRPEVVDAALNKQKQNREVGAAESKSIRVDAEKLDQLINLVGELIIAGASVNLIAHRSKVIELQESTSKLATLVEEVRDSALQLRMVKIGATFSRFQRVVHDVSRELGKDIRLMIDGEDTELDKTVVEKIGDPLMHLVRNSMDHGIESAQARAARGKPVQGTLKLNAFHDSGAIVITVADDGGGLKRDKILAKAIERGLVEAGHHMSDADVYALIFEPGFSTAEKVSNLSGRGVGLDVVKRNITALRGTVGLSSEEGVGTTVTVRLPLTLAIIDGFLVGVDKSVYAIPLDMIEECVAYSAEPGHDYTNLRGQVLPFIRIRELFSVPGKPAKGENIVVLKHAGQQAGLVVDTLLGEFQTVIKPLGPMFAQSKCISGSTILGSGDVALILDVPQLVRQAMAKGGQMQHAHAAVV